MEKLIATMLSGMSFKVITVHTLTNADIGLKLYALKPPNLPLVILTLAGLSMLFFLLQIHQACNLSEVTGA